MTVVADEKLTTVTTGMAGALFAAKTFMYILLKINVRIIFEQ